MTSNVVRIFVFGKPSERGKNSPGKGRGLGHVTLMIGLITFGNETANIECKNLPVHKT